MIAPPHLLLIKPRWLNRKSLSRQVAALRRESPGVRLTLLSDDAPDPDAAEAAIEFVPMPDLWRDARSRVTATVRRLRREAYDQALVLTDESEDELGTHELRFWAFVARARSRRVGSRPLRLLDAENLRRVARAAAARGLLAWLRFREAAVLRSRRHRLDAYQRAWSATSTPVTACPLCGVSLDPAPTPTLARYRRCPECAMLLLADRPAERSLAEYYAECYPAGDCPHWRPASGGRRARLLEAFVYLQAHDRLFGAGRGRLLDAGCGPGFLLEMARKQGWEAHGYEQSSLLAEAARKSGFEVTGGDLAAVGPDGSFQSMMLLDELEHQPDPVALLGLVRRLLAPGGACLLRTPDAGSLDGDPANLLEISHLCYLTETALRRLSERVVLEVVELKPSPFQPGALEVWLRRAHAD